MLYQVDILYSIIKHDVEKILGVIRNFVMNVDFVVPYQYAQLEINTFSKTQKRHERSSNLSHF